MPTYDIEIRDGEFDGFKDLVNVFLGDEFDAYDDNLYKLTDRNKLGDSSYTVGSGNSYDYNYIYTTAIDIISFKPYGAPEKGSLIDYNTGTVFGSPLSVYTPEDGSDNYHYIIFTKIYNLKQ